MKNTMDLQTSFTTLAVDCMEPQPDASGEYQAKQRAHNQSCDAESGHDSKDGIRERYKPPGKNLNHTVKASIEQINEGFTYQFTATIKEPCRTCSRTKPGAPIRCTACNGGGYQIAPWDNEKTPCFDCEGDGKLFGYCPDCENTGTQFEKPVNLKIRIPSGLRPNAELVVPGLGHPSAHGGKNGDLNLTIKIEDHPFFLLFSNLEGENQLGVSIPVTRLDLMCGATINVPTLYGFKTDDLARYDGEVIDVPEAGFRKRDGTVGSLVVLLDVIEQPIEGHALEILRSAYEMMKRQGLSQPKEIAAWKTLVSQPS